MQMLMFSFLRDTKTQPPTKHNIDVELAVKLFQDLTINATG